jgi:hypothetical protein
MNPRLVLLASALLATLAHGQEATFDAQPEGSSGVAINDSGFLFVDLDRGNGTAPDPFVIDDASSTLAGEVAFTPSNALGFGAHVAGPIAQFGLVKSFRILPSTTSSVQFVQLYVARDHAGNTITAEGRVSGLVVSTTSVVIPPGTATFHVEMTVMGSPDEIRISGSGAFDNGRFAALVDTVGPFVIDDFAGPFCGANSAPVACPCGNTAGGADVEGCASSLGYGARLRRTGVGSIASDSIVLLGTQMPNSSALYFQGTSVQSAVFGDGLRCVGGQVTRLKIQTNSGGASSYPSSGDAPISVQGAVPPAGGMRHYQIWYRNAAPFCTSASFNLSNAVSVSWGP